MRYWLRVDTVSWPRLAFQIIILVDNDTIITDIQLTCIFARIYSINVVCARCCHRLIHYRCKELAELCTEGSSIIVNSEKKVYFSTLHVPTSAPPLRAKVTLLSAVVLRSL